MAVAKPQTALTTSITAPIGGWNARDSVAAMPPTDAVTLTNLYPTPTDVQLRKGYSKYSIGITGQVNTVMNYAGANTQKLFAAAGTTIYNCDTPTATSVATITNDKLQYINISNSGGNFLVACNGTDPTLIYDGTNWIKMATTGTAASITSITHVGTVATLTTATVHGLVTGNEITISGASPSAYNGTFVITVTGTSTFTYTMGSTPAGNATTVGSYLVNYGVTGVNPNTFVSVNLFKNRLYFTQKDTLDYGEALNDSSYITSAITDFDTAVKIDNDYPRSSPNRIFQYEFFEVLVKRAAAFEALGNFEKALSDYTRAIEAAPGNDEKYSSYFSRAAIKHKLHNISGAIDDLSVVLQHKPENIPALSTRGTYYLDLQSIKNACSDFSVAAKLQDNASLLKFQKYCN